MRVPNRIDLVPVIMCPAYYALTLNTASRVRPLVPLFTMFRAVKLTVTRPAQRNIVIRIRVLAGTISPLCSLLSAAQTLFGYTTYTSNLLVCLYIFCGPWSFWLLCSGRRSPAPLCLCYLPGGAGAGPGDPEDQDTYFYPATRARFATIRPLHHMLQSKPR